MRPTFLAQAHATVRTHPIVRSNPYTSWFAAGQASQAQVAHLTQQFSVFSHQFIAAQLRKVLNCPDLASYHAGKEILLNELGVAFGPPGAADAGTGPDEVSPTGSVDGSPYRHAAAHFEWLVQFAAPLGLTFHDLGKRRHATPATLRFCDALLELYGSEDPNVAAGASFAIETWAAAGFWGELISGLTAFKRRSGLPLNLGFWVFHDRLEQQHADHTEHELEELAATPGFDPEAFLRGARGLLDAVAGFWEGLAADAGLLAVAA
ncbi:MAG: hypothetical protein LC620_04950 [Halobacteriales archaeon]|nr:hypothetical protein [Halobacteriales archaeon]